MSTASKAMALEYASDQIRFNCICPVAGNTPLQVPLCAMLWEIGLMLLKR